MNAEKDASKETCCQTSCACRGWCPSAETWAILGLRLFLGLRFFVAGSMKFYGIDRKFTFEHYYNGFVDRQLSDFSHTLLPRILTWPFLHSIGYIEIVLGICLLLGIKTKCSLGLTLLTYVGLAFGMMFMPTQIGMPVVSVIGIHILITVAALLLVKHNRFEVWKG